MITKKGWFIWYGDNIKNYLSHEFYSAVHSGKDEDLAAEAKKEKKDKFHPYCLVTVSDITYESDGWKYDKEMYKKRNEVERLFCRLKGYRRIFSRFDKLNIIFMGFIAFALIFEMLR